MEQRNMNEDAKNAFDDFRFYLGLIMGLFLGILGNLCVSLLIETIHAFGTTLFYTWLVVFLASLITTYLVFRWLAKRMLKPFLDAFYTVFPVLKPKKKS
jgi:uncharacterized BrkB/YihY/UPF0761 family membrane protein